MVLKKESNLRALFLQHKSYIVHYFMFFKRCDRNNVSFQSTASNVHRCLKLKHQQPVCSETTIPVRVEAPGTHRLKVHADAFFRRRQTRLRKPPFPSLSSGHLHVHPPFFLIPHSTGERRGSPSLSGLHCIAERIHKASEKNHCRSSPLRNE